MSKTISDVKVALHDVQGGVVVRARVIIGDGQRGAWTMLLGATPIAKGTEPAWVTLGDGAGLRGNHLEVSAVVMDVRDETDRLCITVDVQGPGSTEVVVAHHGNHGDCAAYSVLVVFA